MAQLCLLLQGLSETSITVFLGLGFHLCFGKGSMSKLTWRSAVLSFLQAVRLRASAPLLAVGQKPPSVSCLWSLQMTVYFVKGSEKEHQQRESASKREKLPPNGTHHLCDMPSLLLQSVRSRSLILLTVKGRGYTGTKLPGVREHFGLCQSLSAAISTNLDPRCWKMRMSHWKDRGISMQSHQQFQIVSNSTIN